VTGRFHELAGWSEADYRNFAMQPHIWSNGEYASAVQRLRDNLSEDQLKVLFFEDMHRDKRASLRAIEDFLDLGYFDFPDELLERRVNESPPAEMPNFFQGLFARQAEEEMAKLAKIGLRPGAGS
jgi:hypothetical protein